jgi:hypothetical protein
MEVSIVWLAACYLVQLEWDFADDPRMLTDPDGILAEIYQKARTILRTTTKSHLKRNVIKAGGRYEEAWLLVANVDQFTKVNPSNKDTSHWVDTSLSSSHRDEILSDLVNEGPMEALKGYIWAAVRAKNPYCVFL